MRWLVEVSSRGQAEVTRACVTAESWLEALGVARPLRGEKQLALEDVAVEVRDGVYHVTETATHVVFAIKKTADTAPLSAFETISASVVAESAVAEALVVTASVPVPPRSSGRALEGHSWRPPPSPGQSIPVAPPSGAALLGAITDETKRPHTAPPGKASVTLNPSPRARAPMNVVDETDSTENEGKRAPAPVDGEADPRLPVVCQVASREQDPTVDVPLTYREYAFTVPRGTTADVAADVARAQLHVAQTHLAAAPRGRLVNLAVFEESETEEVPHATPLVTLTWKDWKDAAFLTFPASDPNAAAYLPAEPPAALSPSLAESLKHDAPNAAARAVVPRMGTIPTFPDAFPDASDPGSSPEAGAKEPLPDAETQNKDVAVPVPVPADAAAQVPPSSREPLELTPEFKTSSGRFVRGRMASEELIGALFEAMHDLHFLRDALDGGLFCLDLATEVLPVRTAIIHFFDGETREWLVACVKGKAVHELITRRTPEHDALLVGCARKRRALVVPDAASMTAARHEPLGGARSVIAAPILKAGRMLGALELINPIDGMPFVEDEGHAITYIAEQYAEYLGSRGVVLDPARIRRSAGAL